MLGLLFGFGDFMAQSAIEKRKSDEIDWLRTVRYASIGCAVGPTLSMWYKTLDRLGTKNSISLVTKKILVDQLFASPIINGAVMIMSRVFSGDKWPQIQNKLEDNYMKVMLTSYLVIISNTFFFFLNNTLYVILQIFFLDLASYTSIQFHYCSTTIQGFNGTNSIISLEYIPFIYECWWWKIRTNIIFFIKYQCI